MVRQVVIAIVLELERIPTVNAFGCAASMIASLGIGKSAREAKRPTVRCSSGSASTPTT